MVDTNDIVREWLLATSAVTNLVGTANANHGIYASPDLPEHFDAALGPGIQIFNMDGSFHDEIPALLDDRKCIKVWANVGKNHLAKQIYGAVFDLIHGATNVKLNSGRVVRAKFVGGPQEITDADTGWFTLVGFFQVMAV